MALEVLAGTSRPVVLSIEVLGGAHTDKDLDLSDKRVSPWQGRRISISGGRVRAARKRNKPCKH